MLLISPYLLRFPNNKGNNKRGTGGRPKKSKSGGGQKNCGLSRIKKGRQGAIKQRRGGRIAKRNARNALAALSLPSAVHHDTCPVSEKEVRTAVAVLVKMVHSHPTRDQWPEIARSISNQLGCNYRIVRRVLEKLGEGMPAEQRRKGAGRKPRIVTGTPKADVLVGSLRAGFGARHTAMFINELGVSPRKKKTSKKVLCFGWRNLSLGWCAGRGRAPRPAAATSTPNGR